MIIISGNVSQEHGSDSFQSQIVDTTVEAEMISSPYRFGICFYGDFYFKTLFRALVSV